jgi:hypothetical protein
MELPDPELVLAAPRTIVLAYVPTALGTPETRPVLELMLSPGGKLFAEKLTAQPLTALVETGVVETALPRKTVWALDPKRLKPGVRLHVVLEPPPPQAANAMAAMMVSR